MCAKLNLTSNAVCRSRTFVMEATLKRRSASWKACVCSQETIFTGKTWDSWRCAEEPGFTPACVQRPSRYRRAPPLWTTERPSSCCRATNQRARVSAPPTTWRLSITARIPTPAGSPTVKPLLRAKCETVLTNTPTWGHKLLSTKRLDYTVIRSQTGRYGHTDHIYIYIYTH